MNHRAEWLSYVVSAVPGACIALAAGAGFIEENTALVILSISFVGLNVAHMAATWSRVFLDPTYVRGAMLERAWVPAILALGPILGEAVGYGAVLLGAQYYLSLHHAMMQSYGLPRSAQRRSGRILSPFSLRVDQAACLFLPLGAFLYRAHAVCHTYSSAKLLAPPLWLAVVFAAVGIVALIAHVSREVIAHGRGESVDPLGPAVVLSQVFLWTALPLVVDHPGIPLYALASSHYVQYLHFVWKSEHSRPGLVFVPSWLRDRIAPPSKIAYVVALTAFGGFGVVILTLLSILARAAADASGMRPATALPIAPWVAAMIGVNFSHYWLDHRIWRFRPAASNATSNAPLPQAT